MLAQCCHESVIRHFRTSASSTGLMQAVALVLQCHLNTQLSPHTGPFLSGGKQERGWDRAEGGHSSVWDSPGSGEEPRSGSHASSKTSSLDGRGVLELLPAILQAQT